MDKKTLHKGCLIASIICCVLIFLMFLFPKEGKTLVDVNIGISDEPRELLYVQNDKEIVMKYPTGDRELKRLFLYFDVNEYISGEQENDAQKNGIIKYEIRDALGETLFEDSVSVDRILHEQSTAASVVGTAVGTEFPIKIKGHQNEILSIALKGEGIPLTTDVRLLGNSNNGSHLVLIYNGVKYPGFPLFQMEVSSKEYPYLWDMAVFLFILLCMLVLTRESNNGVETDEKNTKSSFDT